MSLFSAKLKTPKMVKTSSRQHDKAGGMSLFSLVAVASLEKPQEK